MPVEESAIVKKWRQHLTDMPRYLMLDGRRKEARRLDAQRQLLISVADDDDLVDMAHIDADFFQVPPGQALRDLREMRDRSRDSADKWRGDLK